MKQEKIGNLIKRCRKSKNLTQKELAERLNVTDKAVSKWETGRSIPDVMLMKQVCEELDITLEGLLNGEEPEDFISKEEENLRKKKRRIVIAVAIGLFYLFLIGFDFNRVSNFKEPCFRLAKKVTSETERTYICLGYSFKVHLTEEPYLNGMEKPLFDEYEFRILGIKVKDEITGMYYEEEKGTVVGIERLARNYPYIIIVAADDKFHRFVIYRESEMERDGEFVTEVSVGDYVYIFSEFYPCVYENNPELKEYPVTFLEILQQ